MPNLQGRTLKARLGTLRDDLFKITKGLTFRSLKSSEPKSIGTKK